MSRQAVRLLLTRLVILVAVAVLSVSGLGCLFGRGAKGPPSTVPGEEEELVTRIEEVEEEPVPGPQTEVTLEPAAPAGPGETGASGAAEYAGGDTGASEAPAPGGLPSVAEPVPGSAGAPSEKSAEPSAPGESAGAPAKGAAAAPGKVAPKPRASLATTSAGGRVAAGTPAEVPAWAVGKEILVYRVEFLGLTMGYARFTFMGKVSVRGRDAYHVNVRAWTTDFLSVIYPINDTIDYYLDVKTLAPLRQEFAHAASEKDDVAVYDQENGKIVYRYKRTGEIRKQVDVPPVTYDPVSVAYYFRARDLGADGDSRHVYGGRKLWEISSRLLGRERIDFSGKPVDAVVIQPVLKLDGRVTDRGDLRMWLTNDPRHVPVRVYAKFKKIREWTLYAELMPPREGG